ncbi:unnamed protein product [Cyprideis torosa]|uniref:Uncharacterized protein n=1 Tax=Cyprideis torosa TaxID=163714 RepID=A0A7R8ZS86_9CRUS|nr:unnamed protein product [Cyprideis torosa]CAG0895618.1 unnamed protein product [Cyprideis torosa]
MRGAYRRKFADVLLRAPMYLCSTLYVELRKADIALVTNRQKISALSCARGSDFLKMNSEVEKEPSGFEISGEDDGFALPKFDGMEILTGHQGFPESGKTTPLRHIVPGYTENDNQTGGASDQMEVSEDGSTVRKGKNSRGHCKQKKRFTCAVCGKSLTTKRRLQSHEFTHTGEKQFACRICGKSFADKYHLTTHKLFHTGPAMVVGAGLAFGRKMSALTATRSHTSTWGRTGIGQCTPFPD